MPDKSPNFEQVEIWNVANNQEIMSWVHDKILGIAAHHFKEIDFFLGLGLGFAFLLFNINPNLPKKEIIARAT